ncbi:MAG: lipopolysaccharide kinase InaA family protein [Gammaproteobacteria bacterium]
MTNTEIIAIHDAEAVGVIAARSVLGIAYRQGLTPQQWLHQPKRILKVDNGIETALMTFDLGQSDRRDVFIKTYGMRRWWRFRYWLGRERARVLWHISRRLRVAGVAVPESLGFLCWGDKREGGGSAFFAEALADCRDLHRIAAEPDYMQALLRRWNLLEALADTLAACHRAGISHGDFKWSNILIDEASGRHWLIDLDAASGAWLRRGRRMAKDVARFVLNAEEAGLPEQEIQRFIDRYAENRGMSALQVNATMAKPLTKLRARHRRQRKALRD